MLALPCAATAGCGGQITLERLDRKRRDLTLHRQQKVHAGLALGGLGGLLQQRRGVGQVLVVLGTGAPREQSSGSEKGGEDRQEAGLHDLHRRGSAHVDGAAGQE